MTKNQKLCVIILTHNNAATISKCILSASFANEILVMDSGSTDDTCTIAKNLGAKVYSQNWLGYAQQRNAAIKLTSCEWILMLDSDEYLSKQANKLLAQIKSDQFNGYSLRIKLVFRDKIYNYFHNKSRGFLRLFRKDCAQYNPYKQVHEDLQITGMTSYLKNIVIYHQSFNNIDDMITKMNTYTTLNANYTLKHSQKIHSVPKAFVKFFASFCKHYVLNKGFLDGSFGFIYSVHYALSSYFHAVKCVYPPIKKEQTTIAETKQTDIV